MKEKIKTLDKNNEKLKLRKIARKQKIQERGITFKNEFPFSINKISMEL